MPDLFEINLARRVLKLNRMSPAVDVLQLLQKYAHVEITDIPVDADAVCLDLKRPGLKPTVIINRDRSPKRSRFTIAHELGHTLIPWHRGSIIDVTSEMPDQSSDDYEMESEANRFASELLMPEDWVKSLMVLQLHDLPQLARDISFIADVSLSAAVLRLRVSLPRGFIFAEVGEDLVVKSSWRSPGTAANSLIAGDRINPPKEFLETESIWSLRTFDGTYWWWKLPDTVQLPNASTSDWRKILVEILSEYGSEDIQRKKAYVSVSATAANANGVSGSTAEEVYASILQRFSSKAKNDPLFTYLMRHPKITDYMASRARTFRE